MTVLCPVVNPENHRQLGIINKTVAAATRILCWSFDFPPFLDFISIFIFSTLTLATIIIPFIVLVCSRCYYISFHCLFSLATKTRSWGKKLATIICSSSRIIKSIVHILRWDCIEFSVVISLLLSVAKKAFIHISLSDSCLCQQQIFVWSSHCHLYHASF